MNQRPRSSEELVIGQGDVLGVRPIAPGDKAALIRAFEHLSEESRYRRFLAPIRHLTRHELAYFTELDHRDHEALIAVTPEGEIVGVARYVRLDDRPEVAEVAVTVTDAWQGRGVGTALLERLARRARDNDVGSFLGICLADNADMQELLRELSPGCSTRRVGDGLVEVEVELPRRVQHGRVAAAVRVAARGFHRLRARAQR
jgi:GNAT superfamily N-acetyltransferase